MRMLWPIWWFWGRYMPCLLTFWCEEALPRDGSHGIGDAEELGRWMTTQKGVNKLPEEICSREGKVRDGFVLVISIARWNQMHIGSAPQDNKPVTVRWEDKQRRIIVLDIGCRLEFAVDFGLPRKEVNHGITLRVEVWASVFPCWLRWHHIILFAGWANAHICICICGYCKYLNELCYKALVCSMLSSCHDFFILSRYFIVNTATSCVINLYGEYVLFSVALLVIGVIQHWGWCSPKGEGSVTTLVNIPCKNI